MRPRLVLLIFMEQFSITIVVLFFLYLYFYTERRVSQYLYYYIRELKVSTPRDVLLVFITIYINI